MEQLSGYKSLITWQKAYRLTLALYKSTNKFPKEELYGLTSQLRRAAYSIPVNIAEGYARSSSKEYLHFLTISKGSCAEIETLLLLGRDLGYMSQTDYSQLEVNRAEVAKLLQGVINAVRIKS